MPQVEYVDAGFDPRQAGVRAREIRKRLRGTCAAEKPIRKPEVVAVKRIEAKPAQVPKVERASLPHNIGEPEPDITVGYRDNKPTVSIAAILEAASEFYGVPVTDLISDRRQECASRPRHVAMYLAKSLTTLSFRGIARLMGDQDHVTVLRGVQQIAALRQADQEVDALIRTIETSIEPSPNQDDLPPPRPPLIAEVLEAVAHHTGVSIQDIKSERRTVPIVRPRHIAMYLCRHLTPRSMPEIGRRIGGRDHTTVLNAIQRITALRETDPDLDALIRTIQVAIEQQRYERRDLGFAETADAEGAEQ